MPTIGVMAVGAPLGGIPELEAVLAGVLPEGAAMPGELVGAPPPGVGAPPSAIGTPPAVVGMVCPGVGVPPPVVGMLCSGVGAPPAAVGAPCSVGAATEGVGALAAPDGPAPVGSAGADGAGVVVLERKFAVGADGDEVPPGTTAAVGVLRLGRPADAVGIMGAGSSCAFGSGCVLAWLGLIALWDPVGAVGKAAPDGEVVGCNSWGVGALSAVGEATVGTDDAVGAVGVAEGMR